MTRRRVFFSCVLLSAVAAIGRAQVFPPINGNNSHGQKDSIYMVIRDDSAPALTAARVSTIRQAETNMREFYAAGSGGQFDMQFTHILDVPLALNSDGTRPNNWRNLAQNYVRNNYGLEPEDFDSNIFDVNATTADEGQGWSGVYWGGTNDFAIQANINSDWGRIVLNHELGHRVGADHAKALRAVDNADFTPYVWNDSTSAYEVYNSAAHGLAPTPYGVRNDTYGNPFDTMGNITNGAFRMREKLQDLGWLTSAQVPDLNTSGDGEYRLYAHNELDFAVSALGVYGVTEAYDANSLYGLTFQRTAERFSTTSGQFENYTQTIDLEYRVNDNGAGRDGVQFYLDGSLLDLDLAGGTNRNNQERELEVGQSIDDIEFGMSMWDAGDAGNGDFLSYAPPPPSDPMSLRSDWFRFDVLQAGVDAIGNYIDLMVTTQNGLNGLAGDLNQDGYLDQFDVLAFRQGWLADTSGMGLLDAYRAGDMDFSGLTDLGDWILFRQAFVQAGLAAPLLVAVPEASALGLLAPAGAVLGARRRFREGLKSPIQTSQTRCGLDRHTEA
ncbi:MAG: hypothetical protein KDA37_11770 [Planctomycetales bacterium]|nr:hypothetical protein [Planctomycetales bacterium]